jgi:hypothetical protein
VENFGEFYLVVRGDFIWGSFSFFHGFEIACVIGAL